MEAVGKRLVLVDYSWCLYRFKYSGVKMSALVEGREVDTGQIFGMTRLVHSIKKRNPEAAIVFCMDRDPVSRNEEHPGYKEGRPADPSVWEMDSEIQRALLACPGVSLAEVEGKEADDLLAMLAFSNLTAFSEVIVYSGDNDLLQLIPYGVKVSRKMCEGEFEFVGEDYVQDKFGVPMAHLLRYRIIVGDSSDRIPPVVPRLDRAFVKKFVEYWATHSLEETFSAFAISANARKLLERRGDLLRNVSLMSLIKYRKPENAFVVPLKEGDGNLSVVEKYKLTSYRKCLVQLGVAF